MKSTVVDESLSSYKPMYCSREYQTSTRCWYTFCTVQLRRQWTWHMTSWTLMNLCRLMCFVLVLLLLLLNVVLVVHLLLWINNYSRTTTTTLHSNNNMNPNKKIAQFIYIYTFVVVFVVFTKQFCSCSYVIVDVQWQMNNKNNNIITHNSNNTDNKNINHDISYWKLSNLCRLIFFVCVVVVVTMWIVLLEQKQIYTVNTTRTRT